MRFSITKDIAAPPEKVWAILADIDRWSEWTESVRQARRLDRGPLAVGSKAELDQPKLRKAVWTVTDLRPGQAFTWTSTSGGVTSVAGHDITALGDGTSRVELTFVQSGLLSPLVGLIGGSMIRSYLGMEAAGLKRRSEQASPR